MPARRLRVLRVIARLNIGGPARHVTILDRGLRARGHETLLAFGPVGEGEGSLEDLARDLPTRPIPELGRRIRALSDAVAFLRVLRLMFRVRPDVVHTHTAKAGTLGRLAAALYNLTRRRQSRAIVVHTFHGHVLAGYFGPVGDRLVRTTERVLARLTDRIVAISEQQRADLCDRFRIAPPDRVVVVPLGLELDDLLALTPAHPSLRRTLGIADDAVVIGFVGRLVPIKQPLLLAEAFAAVASAAPEAVLLVAGDGPLADAFRADVEARGLTARVRFAGWQRDLRALYATCDVIALVSRNEGTPVAAIEGMAAGRTVVATAVGGVPDVVAGDRTGVLVPGQDPAAIADALLRVVRDAGLRARLGAAARDDVRARFRSERLVEDVERLYLEALADR